MPRYALLLRGVNVGGRSMLAMSDLRSVLESLGHTEVRTYLQSGNAVVTCADPDPASVAATAESALSERTGRPIKILARTGTELAAVIAANPFPVVEKPAWLHVVFLSVRPDPAAAEEIDAAAYGPDEFRFGDRCVYMRFAQSSARSKLPTAVGRMLARAHPGVVETARNWNTVRKLAELTAPEEPE
jgi:uncharacterized protein (DUF1697 family)